MDEIVPGVEPIAIVGLSLRVPGADDAASFWRLVRDGTEAITRFDRTRLLAAGVSPSLVDDPRFVAARGVLEGVDQFDARLFNYSPRQAAATDPQHRLFLECCWKALESAGYPAGSGRRIGVYAGAGINTYLMRHLTGAIAAGELGDYEILIGNDKDFLPLRVSYELDLTGPSLNINTACSSSLVAVHVACQALLSGECDMALAGGVSIRLPQVSGLLHQEGGILSADGYCRAYDAQAGGTVSGDGVGVVVLKRLSDALEAGDVIRAVIRGSAVNNDGGRKVGFTAPSVAGQARVIGEALAVAGIDVGSVGYVEGHGTGTRLGDPLEVAALNEAYRGIGTRIALGSVKPNIGHLDTAAGVVGLIKVVLGLEHGEIPPSINFERPNPEINFAGGPFYVPRAVEPWPQRDGTRRGGVSSFGIGGTNAHVVLEAAPARAVAEPATRRWHVMPVSGRTAEGLGQQCTELSAVISNTVLADAAYTLSAGRRAFPHRRAVVARDAAQAARELSAPARSSEAQSREVALLFPGQGAQRVGMGAALRREQGVHARSLRESADHLSTALDQDVLKLVTDGDEVALGTTAGGQAALFAVSYALARQWEAWGVKGSVLLGHSLGEYVAATVAGVFSLADACRLVAARGKLMETAKGGAMLAVALEEASVKKLCGNGVNLAAVNGTQQCVLSGEEAAIAAVEAKLTAQGHWVRRLGVNYGFHSHLLDPVLDEFEAVVRSVTLQAPQRRMLSSVTGTWLSDTEATDPGYWRRQMRAPVRFWQALQTLAKSERVLCVEMGPGQTVSGLARNAGLATQVVWPTGKDEEESLARAIAGVWEKGVEVDWQAFHGPGRRRMELPGIAFERQRHWLEPKAAGSVPVSSKIIDKKPHLYAPVWRRWLTAAGDVPAGPYLVVQGGAVGKAVAAELRAMGRIVTEVGTEVDYGQLLATLRKERSEPKEIVHTLAVDASENDLLEGFHDAHALVRALIGAGASGTLTIVSRGACAVTGLEQLRPEAATLRALVQVVPQEHPDLRCRLLDLASRDSETTIASDLGLSQNQPLVARRGQQLWVPDRQEIASTSAASPLRQGGTYLITGGLGGIGLTVAQHLARKYKARVALISRQRSEKVEPESTLFEALASYETEWRRQNSWHEQGANAPLKRALDGVAAAYVLDYLRSQGVVLAPEDIVDRARLVRSLAIVPSAQRMFDSMIDTLAAEGVKTIDSLPPARTLTSKLVGQSPTLAPLFGFLDSCVACYPDVMTGKRPGIEILYPVGDPQALNNAMAGMSPFSQYEVYASMLRQAVVERLEEARGRPLRILEIGGGNGAVTKQLLPLLRGRNFHYTFSDLGKSLALEMARWARAEGHDNVSTCVFDITQPWAQQDLDPTMFDIVVGLDVVHATPDLTHTVRNLAALLAPEGLLMLLESANPPRFFDLLFGLAEGWWSYTDTSLRPRSPLLDLTAWESVFRSAGLQTLAFPQTAAARAATDIGLVVGCKPAMSAADVPGAIVEYADVTDGAALRAAFAKVEKRFGRIDGVIHAAGDIQSGPVTARDRQQIEREFAAKIVGTRTLEKVLDDRSPDFLLLCSSVAGVSPGPGDAGHAAANAFLDAFAYARSAEGHRTISVGWDRWEGIGGARRLERLYRRRTGQPMPPGLAVDAALDAFEAALRADVPPHIVVTASGPVVVQPDRASVQPQAEKPAPEKSAVLHERPPLAVPFIAPEGEVEGQIAGIWRAVLGVEQVGRNDDLTELGGDSLIAIQIVARLREAFRVNVTVKSIFETATVTGLAETIEALRWHAGRPERELAAEEEEGTL